MLPVSAARSASSASGRVGGRGVRLAEMSAEDVFAVAVNRGLIGSNLHLLDVGEVAITSNGARGQATRNGQETRLFFRFRKADDGRWRLDLVNLIALGDRVFEAMRERQKVSKEDFVLSLLRAAAAKPVPNDIWSARPDR